MGDFDALLELTHTTLVAGGAGSGRYPKGSGGNAPSGVPDRAPGGSIDESGSAVAAGMTADGIQTVRRPGGKGIYHDSEGHFVAEDVALNMKEPMAVLKDSRGEVSAWTPMPGVDPNAPAEGTWVAELSKTHPTYYRQSEDARQVLDNYGSSGKLNTECQQKAAQVANSMATWHSPKMERAAKKAGAPQEVLDALATQTKVWKYASDKMNAELAANHISPPKPGNHKAVTHFLQKKGRSPYSPLGRSFGASATFAMNKGVTIVFPEMLDGMMADGETPCSVDPSADDFKDACAPFLDVDNALDIALREDPPGFVLDDSPPEGADQITAGLSRTKDDTMNLATRTAIAKANKRDGQPYDVALGDAPTTARWVGVIGVEGEVTGDGRLIQPNALRWESLPLPLRYVSSDSGAHDGAVVVGRITALSRGENGQIIGEGDFDTTGEAGIEAMRHVESGLTNGISMDLDDVSFEVRVASELIADQEDGLGPLLMMASHGEPDENGRVKVAEINSDDEVRVTTDGRIRAGTIVAIPAFASAQIHMAGAVNSNPPEKAFADTAPAGPAGLLPDGVSPCSCDPADPAFDANCVCADAIAPQSGGVAPLGDVTAPMAGTDSTGADCSCTPGDPGYSPDCNCSAPSTPTATLDGLVTPAVPEVGEGTPAEEATDKGMLPDGVTSCSCDSNAPDFDPNCVCAEMPTGLMPDAVTPCSCDETDPAFDPACVCLDASAGNPLPGPQDLLLAAAVPLSPPVAWFSRPRFTQATALRVTPEGRVLGHLASWNTCHLSHTQQGQCITAPKSPSGYAYFHTGTVMTAEGAEIPVGHITLDTRHANERLTPAATASHYEDTGSVVADVTAGEDEWGIWVSGALRPGVSGSQVRALRSAPLSGDWRRIGASLELVAALAVNVPGFPIPRPSGLVAGGVLRSLVASGLVPPKQVTPPGAPGALSLDDLRYLKRLVARERAEEQTLRAAGSLPDATDLARRVRASSFAMRARRRPTLHVIEGGQ